MDSYIDTYAIQLMLYFQGPSSDDARFEGFVSELKALAAKHQINFGDYQSFCLPGEDYEIAACCRCSELTVNREKINGDLTKMLPDFWFYVRKGSLVKGELYCDLCSK